MENNNNSPFATTADGARIVPQWNMSVMLSAAKTFIDAYNKRVREAKAKGEPLTYKVTEGDTQRDVPYKPIHSNARGTVNTMVVNYVKQLNRAVLVTMATGDPLPGFRTWTGSMQALKGFTDRTWHNHKARLTEAGLLLDTRYLGRGGQELYFHPDVLFNGQGDAVCSTFHNHTYCPNLFEILPESVTTTAEIGPGIHAQISAPASTGVSDEKNAQPVDNQHISDFLVKMMGENFSGFSAIPTSNNKIKDRLTQKSGAAPQQVNRQVQGDKIIGAPGNFEADCQEKTAEVSTGENPHRGAGAEAPRNDRRERFFNKKLGLPGNGLPERGDGLRTRNRMQEAPSTFECAEKLTFFLQYALASLYPCEVFSDAERQKIAEIMQESCFWQFKNVFTNAGLEFQTKMLTDRIDLVREWMALNPHFMMPPPHIYFSAARKYKFAFHRTYGWWIKNQTMLAMTLVKREISLWRKGKGRMKDKTLTEMYRIHEQRIIATGIPGAIDVFNQSAEIIYRQTA